MAGAPARKSLSRTMISGARLMPQPRVTRRAGNGWQDIPATRKTNARMLLLARRSRIYEKHDAHISAAVAQSGWRDSGLPSPASLGCAGEGKKKCGRSLCHVVLRHWPSAEEHQANLDSSSVAAESAPQQERAIGRMFKAAGACVQRWRRNRRRALQR